MQDLSALSRTFFHRTNRLAALKGVQVEDLPGIIGIGRRTLFECRSADSAVSPKSWAKLEAAEKKAARNDDTAKQYAESSISPKEPGIGETAHEAYAESTEGISDGRRPPLQDERLLAVLERIAGALEELVENQRRKDTK